MKKTIYTYFLLIFCFLLSFAGKATHIVGGEITYQCLGNDNYRIRVSVFRDCFNGVPWFDNPGSLGIFDVNNQLVRDINMTLRNNDTLPLILPDPCINIPTGFCVHTTTYDTIVSLPFRTGGYQLVYQRCCRNHTINNIVAPDSTGATYYSYISEQALLECNSSASFRNWPPPLICAGVPINFDHSAIDIDGDSLVYEMCTPFHGASFQSPMPQPPLNPPYQTVIWKPSYSVNNMLGGTPPLQVNSSTGLLTGTPCCLGQYVVGVCVREYRRGVLISTTRRDFQYNVRSCSRQTTAAFFTPTFNCNDALEVCMNNQSSGGIIGYRWDFGVPTMTNDTSIFLNPCFSYPDTGTYTIRLITLSPNRNCTDTAYQTISVRRFTIDAAFTTQRICADSSVQVIFNNQSAVVNGAIISWQWRNNGNLFSTNQNPILTVNNTGTYNFELIANASNGCADSTKLSVPIEIPYSNLQDRVLICRGDSIPLYPNAPTGFQYRWSPSTGLSDPNSPNPMAHPSQTTTYTLSISLQGVADTCTITDQITVQINNSLNLSLPNDINLCNDGDNTTTLIAQSATANSFTWSNDPLFTTIIGITDTLMVNPTQTTTYYVRVSDAAGCSLIDSVAIHIRDIKIDLDSVRFMCQRDTIRLNSVNQNPADIVNYRWTPANQIIGATNQASILIAPSDTTVYTLFVQNQYGCTDTLHSRIETGNRSVASFAPLGIVCSDDLRVNFQNTSTASEFRWDFGVNSIFTDTSSLKNPFYIYPDTGVYYITLISEPNNTCADTFRLPVHLRYQSINPDFDIISRGCSDRLSVEFRDRSVANPYNIYAWSWNLGNGQTSSQMNPSTTYLNNGNYIISLTVSSTDGCTNTVTDTLHLSFPQLFLRDSIQGCWGNPVALNPNFNPNFNYEWSPTTYLDNPYSPNPFASPVATTVYTVTASSFNGLDTCKVRGSITVVVPPQTPIRTIPNDSILCLGANHRTILQAFADNVSAYEWSTNPRFTTIIADTDTTTVNIQAPTTYYVRVRDTYSCWNIDSVRFSFTQANIEVDPVVNACKGDTVSITARNLVPTDNVVFAWSGITNIIGSSTANPIRFIANQNLNTVQVVGVNQYGCRDIAFTTVQVSNISPVVDAKISPDSIFAGQTAQLWTPFDPNYSYNWTPVSSLNNPTIHNPVASPNTTTTYHVEVRNNNGCVVHDSVKLYLKSLICAPPYIFVPNAFTPNNDNTNDILFVRGNVIDEVYFAVYDRWGERVFETTTLEKGWDGTYKGQLLAPDVYGYYLQIRCFGGQVYTQKGNITLIR